VLGCPSASFSVTGRAQYVAKCYKICATFLRPENAGRYPKQFSAGILEYAQRNKQNFPLKRTTSLSKAASPTSKGVFVWLLFAIKFHSYKWRYLNSDTEGSFKACLYAGFHDYINQQ
jgi:hypothetical protein